jgi:hypothetical protein
MKGLKFLEALEPKTIVDFLKLLYPLKLFFTIKDFETFIHCESSPSKALKLFFFIKAVKALNLFIIVKVFEAFLPYESF